MNRAEYHAYARSEDWRRRRELLIREHGERCERCGIPRGLAKAWDGEDLNFHHTSYANLGRETAEDGHPLCRPCHKWEKFKTAPRTHYGAEEWEFIAWLDRALPMKLRPMLRKILGGEGL